MVQLKHRMDQRAPARNSGSTSPKTARKSLHGLRITALRSQNRLLPGDGQETMNYYIDLLESAAKHHLLVNFHGATVPRGWQRTYPNLMSVEGVYGAEWYNNAPHTHKSCGRT